MKKLLLILGIILLLSFAWAIPALAATTADVTVTYTVENIEIADNVTTVAFGTIATSATPSTDTSHVGITNTSSVQTDITIFVTSGNWTGTGTYHLHSNTATPGADQTGLKTNRGGTWGVGDIVVQSQYGTPQYIYENCPASTSFDYGLKLYAPTSTSDSYEKTNTVRVSAVAG